MPRVLVADEGDGLLEDACEGLVADGFDVEWVQGVEAAVDAMRVFPADVVLLAMGPGGGDAVACCRALREFSDAYVIVARPEPDELATVLALSVGADDVVGAGTSGREMAARARAMLRRPRTQPVASGPYVVGDVHVDPMTRRALTGGGPVDLTRTEFAILAALCEQAPAVVERGRMVERVWGPGWMPDDHVLDVHMSNLRRKLADAGARTGVTTVRGVGFRLEAAA